MTLLCFRIIYSCQVWMVNIGVRGVGSEVVAKLIYVSRKICIFVYLLLMCSLLRH
jgi:hypothetical protein